MRFRYRIQLGLFVSGQKFGGEPASNGFSIQKFEYYFLDLLETDFLGSSTFTSGVTAHSFL
ncbi:hypothetical protein KHM19_00550 [Leptospira borgpetersenii]|nr:hypothetical protein CLV95_10426 [Leptospira borgpetersenii serovar Javanica]GIM17604.1 hypothetical protein KHM09_00550 [Leptospira borgpetersenii]GIM20872.1 hypothetical protein KHM19_00550 [Leptospira borgpetersenii]GIM24347.1 hypothetical protein KHM25_02720 [Leptospira borgpetersenii]